ncbi:hypothetical protein CpecA_0560 [Chlamydia pecorum IPTaLE]|nr:hypothetical protein CpecA_0560 [Chlamydia pecorum IPTaLE]
MSCDGLLFFINAKLYSLKIGALGEGTPGLGQDVFQRCALFPLRKNLLSS